jgi:hypothetical protein
MSASIVAYWPGITEEQEEEQWAEFNNDYQDWANWMAEGLQEPEVIAAIERAGVLPLATMTTDGVSDDDVYWVSPGDLRKAAARLSRLINAGNADATIIMESYGVTANYGEALAEHFQRDLQTVEALAAWAEEQGVRQMTLCVGF